MKKERVSKIRALSIFLIILVILIIFTILINGDFEKSTIKNAKDEKNAVTQFLTNDKKDQNFTFPIIQDKKIKTNPSIKPPIKTEGTRSSWTYYDDWSRRKGITINNSESVLSDYQVKIKVQYDSDMQNDFDDIRFTESDGNTNLSYWLEEYSDNFSAIFWIKVLDIPTGDSKIYMYYGNPSESSTSNFDNTFTKDFEENDLVALWHVDEGSGTKILDSSGNNNSGNFNAEGAPSWEGFDGGRWNSRNDVNFSSGDSLIFDGSSDYVKIDMALGSIATISAWAKHTGSDDMLWCIDNDNLGPDLWFAGGNIYLNTFDGYANPFCSIPPNVDLWHHYVTVIEPGNTKLYIDGILWGTANYKDPTGSSFYISSGCGYDWQGSIDEFRVYNRTLSPEEIKAHFERRKYVTPEPIINFCEKTEWTLKKALGFGHIHSIDYNPDGNKIAVGGGSLIQIVNTTTYKVEKLLDKHTDTVNSVVFSSNGSYIASASEDKTVRIWDTKYFDNIQTLNHNYSVDSITISPNGKYLASGLGNGEIKIWDTSNWVNFKNSNHSFCINSIAFSPNSSYLASASYKTIKIWNTTDWSEMKIIDAHISHIYSIIFSQNGSYLISGSNKIIKIWNTKNWTEIKVLEDVHTSYVESLAFSPNGEYLASGSNNIKIWNTNNWSLEETLNVENRVYSLKYSPTGENLSSGSWGANNVNLWRTDSWEKVKTLGEGHMESIQSVVYSPNGEYLATSDEGDDGGIIKIWNASDWRKIKTLDHNTQYVHPLVFSKNNEFLVSGSSEGTIKIWNTNDWSLQKNINAHSEKIYSITFSLDGKYLASSSGNSENEIKIWDTNDWSEITTLSGHFDSVFSLDFSSNSNYLASGSNDGTIKIWNSTNWNIEQNLSANSDGVICVSFSFDSSYLATSYADKTIKIWDTGNWSLIKNLSGYSENIYSLAFSNQGNCLAAGSHEIIKIYETSNWLEVKTLYSHIEHVNSVAFSPNDTYLISGGWDTIIRIWRTSLFYDFSISDISLNFLQDNIIEINAVINNSGNLKPSKVQVQFFCNDKLIGEDFISIKKHSSSTVSIQWKPTRGDYTIKVEVDPLNEFTETKKGNNIADNFFSISFKYEINLTCLENKKYISPNNEANYIIIVKNLGNKVDTITFEVISENGWQAKLDNYVINLASLEIENVFLNVTPPTLTKANEKAKIRVLASSFHNGNIFESLITTTTINHQHKSNIILNQTDFNIAPNQILKLNLTIENIGNSYDAFNVSINETLFKIPKYWNYTKFQITKNLSISKKDFLIFYFTPPNNATANSYAKIIFDVSSINFENLTLELQTITIYINQIHNIIFQSEKIEHKTNPGKPLEFFINVKNNGNGVENINLRLSGKNYNWGSLHPKSIILEANDSKNVTLTVTPPENARAGEFAEIEILAGTTPFSINLTTTVEQIHEIKIDVVGESSKNINPNQIAEYFIRIKNNGNGKENVNLELSGKNFEWAEIEKNVILNLNQEKEIKLEIKSPKDTRAYDESEITIMAFSNDVLLGSVKCYAMINQFYDTFLEIEKDEIEIMDGEAAEYKIKITNLGNGEDTIKLKLSGKNSEFAYLNNSILFLKYKEYVNVTLFVRSNSRFENAIIEIFAISGNGQISNVLRTTTTIKSLENKQLKADFKIFYNNKEINKITVGKEIYFDASGTILEDEGYEFIWNLGNGEVRYGQFVNYTYPENTKEGIYKITLTVMDNSEIICEKNMDIEILTDEKEDSFTFYLIVIIVIIIGLIVAFVLNFVVNSLKSLDEKMKNLAEVAKKASIQPKKKEEIDIDLWKPKKEEKLAALKIEEMDLSKTEMEKEKTIETQEIHEDFWKPKKEKFEEPKKEISKQSEKIDEKSKSSIQDDNIDIWKPKVITEKEEVIIVSEDVIKSLEEKEKVKDFDEAIKEEKSEELEELEEFEEKKKEKDKKEKKDDW